jgi:uncharacterized protein (DUF2062 family)
MTGFEITCAEKLKSLTRRIVAASIHRLTSVLSYGMTQKKLALTVCLGTALGIMPLLWGTSLLCLLLAQLFRLNHLALQSVNCCLFPLQLALLVPFSKLGAWLFPGGTPLPSDMYTTLLHNPGVSIEIVFGIVVRSVAAWALTALPLTLLSYAVFRTKLPHVSRNRVIADGHSLSADGKENPSCPAPMPTLPC